MKSEKIQKVYNCCGQYIAPLKNYKGKVICPRCGTELKTGYRYPAITVLK